MRFCRLTGARHLKQLAITGTRLSPHAGPWLRMAPRPASPDQVAGCFQAKGEGKENTALTRPRAGPAREDTVPRRLQARGT